MYVPSWEPHTARKVPNEVLYVLLSRIEKPTRLRAGKRLTAEIVERRYACKEERTAFIREVLEADVATAEAYNFPPDSPVQEPPADLADSDDDTTPLAPPAAVAAAN
jgi:hypothetical protein